MRTLEEYVAMIPAAPPADIDRYLDALGRKPMAITSYRCISRDDAESRLDCEDFRADLRPSAAIRPAALWCSECESWYLAEYVPAYGVPCSPNLTYQNNSGVQVVNVEQDTIDKKRNGETMVCPLCGAQTQLRNVQELRHGRAAQDFIAVPTVAENCLVLTQWCIERHMYEGYRHTERNAAPMPEGEDLAAITAARALDSSADAADSLLTDTNAKLNTKNLLKLEDNEA